MDWQTLRNQFMRDIGGDPPGANLEDELINAYANNPDPVERSFQKITLAFKAGKIRSPWGALKTEVAKATDQARNPTHDRGASKTKALARAEQWMRTAGLHHDRETELLDELYGERGRLREHPETKARMLELWNELRPVGAQLDQAAIDRGHRHQKQRKLLKPPPADKPNTNVADLIRQEIAEAKARLAAQTQEHT